MHSRLRIAPAPSFAALVQRFFSQYLMEQRALSPRTIAAYRDTFVLFLDFVAEALRNRRRPYLDGHDARTDPGVSGSFGAHAT